MSPPDWCVAPGRVSYAYGSQGTGGRRQFSDTSPSEDGFPHIRLRSPLAGQPHRYIVTVHVATPTLISMVTAHVRTWRAHGTPLVLGGADDLAADDRAGRHPPNEGHRLHPGGRSYDRINVVVGPSASGIPGTPRPARPGPAPRASVACGTCRTAGRPVARSRLHAGGADSGSSRRTRGRSGNGTTSRYCAAEPQREPDQNLEQP